tara:strand:+ start:275 stop:403 length:129 start_codon:yes stop_codon:yes gene_type:complete
MLYAIAAILLSLGILLYRQTMLVALLFGFWVVWSRGGFEWLL